MDYKGSPVNSNSGEALDRSVANKHLTPCRQMGLRRKIGSVKSDDTSASKKICLSSPSFGTPKGAPRLPTRKRLMTPFDNSESECLSIKSSECKEALMLNLNSTHFEQGNEYNLNDPTMQITVGTNQSEFSYDTASIKSVSNATSVLEDIKKRIDAKEKLKNSLQQRLYKMKKGNEHVSRLKRLQGDWKEACQESLKDLLDKTNMQGQFLTMKQLMEKLGISNELLTYNSDEDEFGDYYP